MVIKGDMFPQLSQLAQRNALKDRLQRHLRARVVDCTVEELSRKTAHMQNLRMTAWIETGEGIVKQAYHGKAFAAGHPGAANAFKRAQELPCGATAYGPPYIYDPEWNIFLWAFPNDPTLPGVKVLSRPERIKELLRENPDKFGLDAGDLRQCVISSRLLKYSFRRRCGYLIELHRNSNGSATPPPISRLYAKSLPLAEAKRVYHNLKKIWNTPERKAGKFTLPRPYGLDKDHGIIWMAAIEGQPFSKAAATAQDLASIGEEVGRRLAAFHSSEIDLPALMTFEYQVRDTHEKIRAITQKFPESEAIYGYAGERLEKLAGAITPQLLTPVHGSFKFSHIFSTPQGIAFIDFDSANLGDPGYDVGRFIAHLYKMSISGQIADRLAERTIDKFCNGYEREARNPLDQARINWFTLSHLVASQGYKAVKKGGRGMLSKVNQVIKSLLET